MLDTKSAIFEQVAIIIDDWRGHDDITASTGCLYWYYIVVIVQKMV